MITRWHIKLYWFTIIFLGMFLIFLSIPNQVSISSDNQKSRDAKISDLASQSASATSTLERSKISRQYSTLKKKDSHSMDGDKIITLIPVKITLLVAMIAMIYFVIQNIWYRQKNLKTSGEA